MDTFLGGVLGRPPDVPPERTQELSVSEGDDLLEAGGRDLDHDTRRVAGRVQRALNVPPSSGARWMEPNKPRRIRVSWCRDAGVGLRERAGIEMMNSTVILYFAGVVGKINTFCLASMEMLNRRIWM